MHMRSPSGGVISRRSPVVFEQHPASAAAASAPASDPADEHGFRPLTSDDAPAVPEFGGDLSARGPPPELPPTPRSESASNTPRPGGGDDAPPPPLPDEPTPALTPRDESGFSFTPVSSFFGSVLSKGSELVSSAASKGSELVSAGGEMVTSAASKGGSLLSGATSSVAEMVSPTEAPTSPAEHIADPKARLFTAVPEQQMITRALSSEMDRSVSAAKSKQTAKRTVVDSDSSGDDLTPRTAFAQSRPPLPEHAASSSDDSSDEDFGGELLARTKASTAAAAAAAAAPSPHRHILHPSAASASGSASAPASLSPSPTSFHHPVPSPPAPGLPGSSAPFFGAHAASPPHHPALFHPGLWGAARPLGQGPSVAGAGASPLSPGAFSSSPFISPELHARMAAHVASRRVVSAEESAAEAARKAEIMRVYLARQKPRAPKKERAPRETLPKAAPHEKPTRVPRGSTAPSRATGVHQLAILPQNYSFHTLTPSSETAAVESMEQAAHKLLVPVITSEWRDQEKRARLQKLGPLEEDAQGNLRAVDGTLVDASLLPSEEALRSDGSLDPSTRAFLLSYVQSHALKSTEAERAREANDLARKAAEIAANRASEIAAAEARRIAREEEERREKERQLALREKAAGLHPGGLPSLPALPVAPGAAGSSPVLDLPALPELPISFHALESTFLLDPRAGRAELSAPGSLATLEEISEEAQQEAAERSIHPRRWRRRSFSTGQTDFEDVIDEDEERMDSWKEPAAASVASSSASSSSDVAAVEVTRTRSVASLTPAQAAEQFAREAEALAKIKAAKAAADAAAAAAAAEAKQVFEFDSDEEEPEPVAVLAKPTEQFDEFGRPKLTSSLVSAEEKERKLQEYLAAREQEERLAAERAAAAAEQERKAAEKHEAEEAATRQAALGASRSADVTPRDGKAALAARMAATAAAMKAADEDRAQMMAESAAADAAKPTVTKKPSVTPAATPAPEPAQPVSATVSPVEPAPVAASAAPPALIIVSTARSIEEPVPVTVGASPQHSRAPSASSTTTLPPTHSRAASASSPSSSAESLKAARIRKAQEEYDAECTMLQRAREMEEDDRTHGLADAEAKLHAAQDDDEATTAAEEAKLAASKSAHEALVQRLSAVPETMSAAQRAERAAALDAYTATESAAWDVRLGEMEAYAQGLNDAVNAAKAHYDELVAHLRATAPGTEESGAANELAHLRDLEAQEEEAISTYEREFDTKEDWLQAQHAAALERQKEDAAAAAYDAQIAQEKAQLTQQLEASKASYLEMLAAVESAREQRDQRMAECEAQVARFATAPPTLTYPPPPTVDGTTLQARLPAEGGAAAAPAPAAAPSPKHAMAPSPKHAAAPAPVHAAAPSPKHAAEPVKAVAVTPPPAAASAAPAAVTRAPSVPAPAAVAAVQPLSSDPIDLMRLLALGEDFTLFSFKSLPKDAPAGTVPSVSAKRVFLWAEFGTYADAPPTPATDWSDLQRQANFFCCDSAKSLAPGPKQDETGRTRIKEQKLPWSIIESVSGGKTTPVLQATVCAGLAADNVFSFGGARAMVSLEAASRAVRDEWVHAIREMIRKASTLPPPSAAMAAAAPMAAAAVQSQPPTAQRSQTVAPAASSPPAVARSSTVTPVTAASSSSAAAPATSAAAVAPAQAPARAAPAAALGPYVPPVPGFHCILPPLLDIVAKFRSTTKLAATDSLSLLAYGCVMRLYASNANDAWGQPILSSIVDQLFYVDFTARSESRVGSRGRSAGASMAGTPRSKLQSTASPVLQASLYYSPPGKRSRVPGQAIYLADILEVTEGCTGAGAPLFAQAGSKGLFVDTQAAVIPASHCFSLLLASDGGDPSSTPVTSVLALQAPSLSSRSLFLQGLYEIFDRQHEKMLGDGSVGAQDKVVVHAQREPEDDWKIVQPAAPLSPRGGLSPRRVASPERVDVAPSSAAASSSGSAAPPALDRVVSPPPANPQLTSLLLDVLSRGEEFTLYESSASGVPPLKRRVFLWVDFPDTTEAASEEEEDTIHSAEGAVVLWCDALAARGVVLNEDTGEEEDAKGEARFEEAGNRIVLAQVNTLAIGKKTDTMRHAALEGLANAHCFSFGTKGQRVIDLQADADTLQQLWSGAIKHFQGAHIVQA